VVTEAGLLLVAWILLGQMRQVRHRLVQSAIFCCLFKYSDAGIFLSKPEFNLIDMCR